MASAAAITAAGTPHSAVAITAARGSPSHILSLEEAFAAAPPLPVTAG
jgi:hypothetical protein